MIASHLQYYQWTSHFMILIFVRRIRNKISELIKANLLLSNWQLSKHLHANKCISFILLISSWNILLFRKKNVPYCTALLVDSYVKVSFIADTIFIDYHWQTFTDLFANKLLPHSNMPLTVCHYGLLLALSNV